MNWLLIEVKTLLYEAEGQLTLELDCLGYFALEGWDEKCIAW